MDSKQPLPPTPPPVAQLSPTVRVRPRPGHSLTTQPGTAEPCLPTASHSHGARSTPAIYTDTETPPSGEDGEEKQGSESFPRWIPPQERAQGDKTDSPKKKTGKTRNIQQKEAAIGEGQTAVQTKKTKTDEGRQGASRAGPRAEVRSEHSGGERGSCGDQVWLSWGLRSQGGQSRGALQVRQARAACKLVGKLPST